MIGGLIAPRCITFLRCLDRAEKNCHFRKAGGAICSDVTKKHLVKARGLAPATICQHMRYTLAMLNRLGIRRASQFMGWTPELIEQYVAGVGRFASPRIRHVGWCTRSFLRFLLQEGLIRRDLATAVPPVARWRWHHCRRSCAKKKSIDSSERLIFGRH